MSYKTFENCLFNHPLVIMPLVFFGSMIGSDSSTTNFPGKIPSGIDVPSDAAATANGQAFEGWSAHLVLIIFEPRY